MADADIQALLDTSGTGRGIRIIRRMGGSTTTLSSYYVVDTGGPNHGEAYWVDVLVANTDAQKAQAIIDAAYDLRTRVTAAGAYRTTKDGYSRTLAH